MVLKNSKWDKQAKHQYLAKHGLLKKDDEEPKSKRKWSSKKKKDFPQSLSNPDLLNDSESNSDWDSEEDEALLMHFYPSIGEGDLSRNQKIKIRNQIMKGLKEEQEENLSGQEELGGIYLGTVPGSSQEKGDEMVLANYLLNNGDSIPVSTKRKMLKNKISDDFLSEYGISSYQDTVQHKKSYDELEKKKLEGRSLSQIPVSELIGFKVGQSSISQRSGSAQKPEVLHLSEQEKKEELTRKKLADDMKFLESIKKKFTASEKTQNPRVLEVNNVNNEDKSQLEKLNTRIQNNEAKVYQPSTISDFDDNLSLLLQGPMGRDKTDSTNMRQFDIDEQLKGLQLNGNRPELQHKPNSFPDKNNDLSISREQEFLDDLLG